MSTSTTEAIDVFLDNAKYLGLRYATHAHYGWALQRLLDTHESLPETSEGLRSFIVDNDLAQTSRVQLWKVLKVFFHYLSSEYGVPNAMAGIHAPKRGRRGFPRTLERGEIDRLLEAVKRRRREHAIVALMLDSGVRVGECAAIAWERVHPDAITVDGKTGPRRIPVSADVMRLLWAQRSEEAQYLWDGLRGRLSVGGMKWAVRTALGQIGVHPPRAGPHLLRHTFGLGYIMRGGDIFSLQKIMGHRSIATTQIYVDMNFAHVKAQHARYSPWAGYQERLLEDEGSG